MSKEELRSYVKDQVAALISALDLDEILGSAVLEELANDEAALRLVEKCQNRICEQIKWIELHGVGD